MPFPSHTVCLSTLLSIPASSPLPSHTLSTILPSTPADVVPSIPRECACHEREGHDGCVGDRERRAGRETEWEKEGRTERMSAPAMNETHLRFRILVLCDDMRHQSREDEKTDIFSAKDCQDSLCLSITWLARAMPPRVSVSVSVSVPLQPGLHESCRKSRARPPSSGRRTAARSSWSKQIACQASACNLGHSTEMRWAMWHLPWQGTPHFRCSSLSLQFPVARSPQAQLVIFRCPQKSIDLHTISNNRSNV